MLCYSNGTDKNIIPPATTVGGGINSERAYCLVLLSDAACSYLQSTTAAARPPTSCEVGLHCRPGHVSGQHFISTAVRIGKVAYDDA